MDQGSGVHCRVFIVSAARTPIGKCGGGLSTTPAVELGGVAIRAAFDRSGLPQDAHIDEVLMGQVLQAGVGEAPARQGGVGEPPTRRLAVTAGLADPRPATTINRVCGSALKAVMLAAQAIKA